jgi:trans-aconitate 2-methyltransferase
MTWSPEQYQRFKDERKQPFLDLVALVERRPRMRVVDLGCGTGELTRELHEALDAEETVGIDDSETMLLKSGHFEGQMLRFERGSIEAFVTDKPYDLVFSNAALHWIASHEELITRLTNFLARNGQLAIQMPANDSHASHRVAADVAREFGLKERPSYVLEPERYAELLHRLGYKRQHVRLQVYGHLLPAADDVVEWVRGALLTYYESQLDAAKYDQFLNEYRARLRSAIGAEAPFFYTYKRVLLCGSF